ncbi:MAG: hypothetical protein AAF799_01840 [Myxococcota bacterium]
MPWSAPTLPTVVLQGLDRGESRVGLIAFIVTVVFAAILAVLMVVLPDPKGEVPEVAPGMFGGLGALAAYFGWLSRKFMRVHRSGLGRVLLHHPDTIVSVRERIMTAGTSSVSSTDVAYDGEREFQPRRAPDGNVLGVKMRARSWFHLKLRGKWIARKLVVPSEHAPELASWLFARVAEHNKECSWGDRTVASYVGEEQ